MGSRDREGQPGTLEAHDPTEEVGPQDCEVPVQETETSVGSIEENPDASHPKFSEELQDAYQPEREMQVPHPVDGLPIPADELAGVPLAVAPPFTYDTVVCVEDDRTWVEVFNSEVYGNLPTTVASGDPPHLAFDWGRVELWPRWNSADGSERERRVFAPEHVEHRNGLHVAMVDPIHWVVVRPLRPRCEHYKRQVFSNDAEPDQNAPGHKILFRNCMKRLSVGGAAMSLRDEAVYACDHRSPPDLVSIRRHLDDPDAERLRSDAHKVMVPLFKTKE